MSADGRPVQVMMVNLQGDENTLPSMEAGLVDGVVANEPMPSILVHKKAGHRVVDLSSLPPAGKWKNHPCCVVAATDAALRDKRAIITSLLKAIAAGTDIIQRDRQKALAAEAAWTRTAPEIGAKSIRNVNYVARADQAWLAAVDTWIDLMQSSNGFQKGLKGKTAVAIRAALFDLKPLEEALTELRSDKKERTDP
jgi:NitT/TauT family transport system substrate-binding protein